MPTHFSELLDALRADVARMTSKVQRVVEQATESLILRDPALAQLAIDGDKQVDHDEVVVEKNAISLLALYQPAAADLRFITSVIKVNNDFERIADCAVNVAQRVPMMARQRDLILPRDLIDMANAAVEVLRNTINAFNLGNVELAKDVIRSDGKTDALYHQIVQDTLANLARQVPPNAQPAEAPYRNGSASRFSDDGETEPRIDRAIDEPPVRRIEVAPPNLDPTRELAVIMIAKNFERVGDHCTNIAEDILYISSGQIVRHLHTVQ